MKKFQYDEIKIKLSDPNQGWRRRRSVSGVLKPEFVGKVRFIAMEGLHKGKVGILDHFDSTTFFLKFEDVDTLQKLHYTKIEEVDADGKAKVIELTDMIGEPVGVGMYVCYSQATSYSHCMEVGKIIEISPTGKMTVKGMVRDGEKVETNAYWRNEKKIDCWRCIKMPVDETRFMMCLLTDFESIGTDVHG